MGSPQKGTFSASWGHEDESKQWGGHPRIKVGRGLAFLDIICVAPQQANAIAWCRGEKRSSITIRLETAFECRHRHLAWSNRSSFVSVHRVVHLFAASVWRCIFRVKNQKVSVANWALWAPSVWSRRGHASLYLDMQIFKMRRTSVNIIGCCVDDLMVVVVWIRWSAVIMPLRWL